MRRFETYLLYGKAQVRLLLNFSSCNCNWMVALLREDEGFQVYCMQVCCCFKSRLSLIVRVNVVLNRTVVVDSD